MNFWAAAFFIVVAGAALAVRMAYGHWQAWLVWVGTSTLAWIVFWSYWGSEAALAGIAAASFLGVESPEIGRAVASGLQDLVTSAARFLFRPWTLAAIGLAYLFFFQSEFLGRLLPALGVMVIIAFGIWVMIGRPGRRRRA